MKRLNFIVIYFLGTVLRLKGKWAKFTSQLVAQNHELRVSAVGSVTALIRAIPLGVRPAVSLS